MENPRIIFAQTAAQQAKLTGQVRPFLDWLGEGRKLTQTGRIGLADARYLVELPFSFSSQGDGTLTVIKEKSPTSFVVEQNVQTMNGAKTCTLDAKTGKILLIAGEYGPAASVMPASPGLTDPASSQQANLGIAVRKARFRAGFPWRRARRLRPNS